VFLPVEKNKSHITSLIHMKIKLTLIIGFALLFHSVNAQVIQGSIRKGPAANQVEVWIKPDFDNNNVTNIAQMLMPLAFPASVSPLPTLTAANITLDPGFIATFGNNYTIQVYAMSGSTDNTEKYFSVALVRGGAGAGNPQTWVNGTAYKVLTASFQGSPASTQIKLADYQDAGTDGQGNFYAADGVPTYFYDFTDSRNNFFAISGESTTGGTVQAGFAQTIPFITLPANITSFSGYKSGGENTLNWIVASEVNNRGFEVLRSTDGVNYSSIGFVNSQVGGFSNTEQHYTFDDNSPSGKKQYYQLSQKDIDGRSKLSTIVMITRDKPTTLDISGLFPNPARTEVKLMIEAPQAGKITVLVTDINGKTVIQKVESVGLGSNTIPVDITKLATGRYVVKLQCQSSDCETAGAMFNKE